MPGREHQREQMQSQAFHTLGIEPTIDGRAIRAAFVRLARIYHPDRLIGQPDDVRSEAEKRMKEASAAYELLRATNRLLHQGQSIFKDKDLEERARKYREAMEARQREEERARIKWRRWEAIEQAARERAEAESQLAAAVEREAGVVREAPTTANARQARAAEIPLRLESKTPSSGLQRRLQAARRKEREAAREASGNGTPRAAP